MKAIVKGKTIHYNDQVISVDELYDDDFYDYQNNLAEVYRNEFYGSNEVYCSLIQDYLAIELWLTSNRPDEVNLQSAESETAFLFIDCCKKHKIRITGHLLYKKLRTWIIYKSFTLASSLYLAWLQLNIRHVADVIEADKFAVVRTKASIKKFKKFTEIQQEIEDPFAKDSIYRLYPKIKRIKWALASYFKAKNSFSCMRAFYEPLIGKNFKFAMMSFYKKRIVHTELYRYLIDDYFSNFKNKSFYTGNNLDRFSIIEEQAARKYGIKVYVIPHGIEYGFKFPTGFSGDIFYAHSQSAADHLNRLYGTSKFVFDKAIINRMYEYNYTEPHERMIIYFTEPREVYVNINIIKELLPKVQDLGRKLYIKLHPGDNKENYRDFDVELCTNYDLSLTGNICISRKSTILIEAIYNHSLPIAIITNPKDKSTFNQFPALCAKEIIRTYNVDELFEVIKENLE